MNEEERLPLHQMVEIALFSVYRLTDNDSGTSVIYNIWRVLCKLKVVE